MLIRTFPTELQERVLQVVYHRGPELEIWHQTLRLKAQYSTYQDSKLLLCSAYIRFLSG